MNLGLLVGDMSDSDALRPDRAAVQAVNARTGNINQWTTPKRYRRAEERHLHDRRGLLAQPRRTTTVRVNSTSRPKPP